MIRKLTAGLLVAAALGGSVTAAALAATSHPSKVSATVVRDRASLDRSSGAARSSSKDGSRDRSSTREHSSQKDTSRSSRDVSSATSKNDH